MDMIKLKGQGKSKIWRIIIGDEKRKKIIGFKLVDGDTPREALSQKNLVGEGRTILGVLPTGLKGTTKQRWKIPRSKRFGEGFW
jgi:hypothetical protein